MMKWSPIRRGVAIIAAPFLLLPTAVLAKSDKAGAETGLSLKATSNWALDYSEDSCRVGRFFGEGEERTLLQMTQFEPDHTFMLAIAGGGLGKKVNAGRAKVQFGPVHPPRDGSRPADGDIGDYKPGLIFSTMAVRGTETTEPSRKASDQERIANFQPSDPITLEDEAKVEWIEISVDSKPRLRLQTGSMGELFTALNTCSEELLLHWGLDVERHRTISSKPVPTKSPGQWITANAYPDRALMRGEQAIIYFRLMVDADGQPESCHIQQSGYSKEFDEAVCGSLMKNARFKPALDAEGKPMKSYFRTTVIFKIP